jgi:hypothetical protein
MRQYLSCTDLLLVTALLEKVHRKAVLTNELDNALPTHLIRKVQICPKLKHLTKDKHAIHDLFLPLIFIVFIILYPWNSGETTGTFLDPVEASVEEKLDLEGEKGENWEAVRKVARTGGAGGEQGEATREQCFFRGHFFPKGLYNTESVCLPLMKE